MSQKPKVQAINPTVKAIEPPEGWEQKSVFGFMGIDSTPAGRLVRLADVLRWVVLHPSLKPYPAAFAAFCEAMPGDAMQWLYRVHLSGENNGYAIRMPPDFMFAYLTPQEIAAAKDKAWRDNAQRMHVAQNGGRFPGLAMHNRKVSTVDAKQSAAQALYEPTEPGLPALLKRIHSRWSNNEKALDHSGEYLTFLAVPLDKAAQHWGYGQILAAVPSAPTTFAELVAHRKENPGADWTQTTVDILKAEVATRLHQKGHRLAIAKALGYTSVTRIGQLLSKDWQAKRENAPALKSVKS